MGKGGLERWEYGKGRRRHGDAVADHSYWGEKRIHKERNPARDHVWALTARLGD